MPFAIVKNTENDQYTIIANKAFKTPGLPFAVAITYEKEIDESYLEDPPEEISEFDPEGWTKNSVSVIFPDDEQKDPIKIWEKGDKDVLYTAAVTPAFCTDLHVEKIPFAYKNMPYLFVREKFLSRILRYLPVPLYFGYLSPETDLDPAKWTPDSYKLFEIYTVDRHKLPELRLKLLWRRTEGFTRFRDGPDFKLTAYGDAPCIHDFTEREVDAIRRSIQREVADRDTDGEDAVLTGIFTEFLDHFTKSNITDDDTKVTATLDGYITPTE